MNYILDASVTIKWFIPEIHWEKAAQLQNYSEFDLHAPDFFQLECTNILSKKLRRKELTINEANTIQTLLLGVPIQVYPWQDLLIDAGQIAHTTYRSVYDCLYLALAKHLSGKMITADKKLYLALKNSSEWSSHLLWIEDIRSG